MRRNTLTRFVAAAIIAVALVIWQSPVMYACSWIDEVECLILNGGENWEDCMCDDEQNG